MKKLLALGFLVALLSLALTACFSAAPGNGLVGEDYGTTEQLGEGALRLGDREVWLKEATADEITELRLTCFGYVTSDDRFCSILTVTDKAELGNLLSAYGSVALTPTEAEYELTDRIYTVELVFADGSSRSMDFAGGLLYSDPAEPDGV